MNLNMWIENKGGCPVETGTMVDVLYRDGMEKTGLPADVECPEYGRDASGAFWRLDNGDCNDITHWRLAHKEESAERVITNKELVEHITASVEKNKLPVDVVDTNPKKQFGDKSLPLNLWPALATAYGCLGLYAGKMKYGMCNFNATPVEASIYIAAAMRHLQAWQEGEEYDPADGVPNLGGVLANIAILLEARANNTLVDDRKLGVGYLKERESLKEIVGSLQELHKDKQPRHYTIKDKK